LAIGEPAFTASPAFTLMLPWRKCAYQTNVPEPSTWAMMLIGFAGLFRAGRVSGAQRHRRSARDQARAGDIARGLLRRERAP
jgi:hypothetical protein